MAKKKGSVKYEHKHTHNPKARESDERKHERLKNMEVKRMQGHVDRCMSTMRSYLPPGANKKRKIDPLYELKGAARAAREFYRPPDYEEEIQPIDLFEEYKGRLWEHEEGKLLLQSLLKLGIAQHNIAHKTDAAVETFKEMLELDSKDHIFARHHLLRCYLDQSDAAMARQLLDKYPQDLYCCFAFTRALIEFISWSLEEPGSSQELAEEMLEKAIEANPYAIWTLLYAPSFYDAVDHLEALQEESVSDSCNIAVGSVEDAFRFFDADMPVWEETDGAIDWCVEFVTRKEITPPVQELVALPSGGNSSNSGEESEEESNINRDGISDGDDDGDDDDEGEDEENNTNHNNKRSLGSVDNNNSSSSNSGDNDNNGSRSVSNSKRNKMYLGMFFTAIEMAEDEAEEE